MPTLRQTAPALLACAAAALWADFGGLHALHSADTLMQTLVSLVRWTPYYWGQDRFGMLVALLAWPFRDALTNLLVQYFLLLFAFLSLPLWVLRWAGASSWAVGGALASALWLAFVPPPLVFEFVANPYALGLLLVILSLEQAVHPSWVRRLVALGLAAIAAWVHGAIAPLGLLLAFTHWRLQPKRELERLVVPAAVMCLAGLSGWVFNRLAQTHTTRMNPMPISQWPHGWAQLALNAFSDLGGLFFLGVGVALILGVIRADTKERRIAFMLLSAAVGYGLLVGMSSHVQAEGGLSRYVAPSLYVIAAAAFGLVTARVRWPAWTPAAIAILLMGAATMTWGTASWGKPRALLEAQFGPSLDAARSAGCTHVVGSYWFVWPVQLMSLMRGPSPIWAVSLRSEVQAAQWGSGPRKLCASPGDDAEAARWSREHQLGDVIGHTREHGLDVLEVRTP